MDSKYEMEYIEDNNEISSCVDVDIQRIEDALLKFVDDMIKSC